MYESNWMRMQVPPGGIVVWSLGLIEPSGAGQFPCFAPARLGH